MIEGVKILELKTFSDERGFFREMIRFSELGIDAKQISHAHRGTGVANGWHIHQHHSEIFYVSLGVMRLVLKDCRNGETVLVEYPYSGDVVNRVNFGKSSTPNEYMEIILGEFDPKVIVVPNGVAHGYKILSGECDIIYAATATYETSRHDEGRIPYAFWPEHQWHREIDIR